MKRRNPHAKSCIRVYNDTPHLLSKCSETLPLEGVIQVYSGCSLELTPSAIVVNNSGLYHFSADITFTPTKGTKAALRLALNGTPLASTFSQVTTEKGPSTLHVETELCLNTCCMNHPNISVVLEGIEGTVDHLTMGALKLA